MDQLIQKYYPRNLDYTVIKHTSISPQIIQSLVEEIKDSKYSSFVSSQYLSMCNTHEIHKTLHCTLHIISPSTEVPPQLLILRTLRRVECIMNIYGISNKKHLTFWLLPTSHLRKFPKNKNLQVSAEHINGGFTYSNANSGTIFVFRREEFPKVFLHETLHHAPIDTHSAWSKTDLQKIYSYFRLDTMHCNSQMQCTHTDLRPNEAWIETWAELYHMGFLQYEYQIPWNTLWNAEKKWACLQAKRVLEHQKAQMDGKWREETHAYSYMVLRAALLWCAPKLLDTYSFNKTIVASTTKTTNITRINTTQLAQFMFTCFNNSSFQKCLRETKLPPLSRNSSFRMTVFGDL